MLISAVMRYADSMLKGFVTSVSIVFATWLSVWIFNEKTNEIFVLGAFLVLISVFLYAKYPYIEVIAPYGDKKTNWMASK